MTEKELKKLSRIELLELLLQMSEDMAKQEEELKAARAELEERRAILSRAGSIAEATVRLNGLFETAQRTADDYLKNVRASVEKERAALAAGREAVRAEKAALAAEKRALAAEREELERRARRISLRETP